MKNSSQIDMTSLTPNTVNYPPSSKLRAAIIGCTGLVGHTLVQSLADHPWFTIASLHAQTNVGAPYGESASLPPSTSDLSRIFEMEITPVSHLDPSQIDVVFSAIPTEAAYNIESKLAEQLPIISTASAFRNQPDVPILLPLINPHHAQLLRYQQKNRNWKGFICPGPNCTTVGLAIALYPIYAAFGLHSVQMVSMQAISGAGYHGLPAYDILGNIIPYIPHEEEKIPFETRKIFASWEGSLSNPLDFPEFPIDCKCNRVPVLNGHMLSVFFETPTNVTLEEIQQTLCSYTSPLAPLNLPNSPSSPIVFYDNQNKDRPQPRLDLNSPHAGMQTYIGGLTTSNHKNGFKMTVLSHNTELGAGRGAVLNAEFLYRMGFFGN